jgi:lipopolysaccharide biosynthesis regulator YciM
MIEAAKKISDSVNLEFQIHWAETELYLELNDRQHAATAIDAIERLMRTYDVEALQPQVAVARGRIDEANGDWARAAERYRERLRSDRAPEVMVRLARCQRQLHQRQEAHATLTTALQLFPALPQAHDELARLLVDEKRPKEAAEELAAALAVWAHADDKYQPAADARALRATLATK